MVDKEEGVKAFEAYMKIAYPALVQRGKQQDEEMGKLLKAWTSVGALRVTPGPEVKMKSRMKQRLVKVENEKMDNVYKKAGERWSR